MNDAEYIKKLEDVIQQQLLPVYNKYYILTKNKRPPLDILDTILIKKDKKVPALLKYKNDSRNL